MPDTGAPWNIPYVESTDLVSGWPTDSLALANAIADGLDAANVGIGSNLVSAAKLDTFTTTASSYTGITGLSVSITPSSATSKVLVVAYVAGSTNPAVAAGRIALRKNSTAIFIGDAAGSRTRVSGTVIPRSDGHAEHVTLVFLDSPATTSPVTYDVAGHAGGQVLAVNRAFTDTDNSGFFRHASSITAIEVAA